MTPEVRSQLFALHSLRSHQHLPSGLHPMIDLEEMERCLKRSYRNTIYMASVLAMLLATITAIAALD